MKTTLKVLATIAKIATIVMAIVGVLLTITAVITTKTCFDHVDDILDEDIDKDAIEIASEAYGKAVIDERVMDNPIVKLTSKMISPLVDLFVKF